MVQRGGTVRRLIAGLAIGTALCAFAWTLVPGGGRRETPRASAQSAQQGRARGLVLTDPGAVDRAGEERNAGGTVTSDDQVAGRLPEFPAAAPLPRSLAALERLLARDRSIEVVWAKEMRVPSTIAGDLRGPDTRDAVTVARAFLAENADLFGIRSVDDELVFNEAKSDFHDAETGWSMVRFDQVAEGKPVYQHALGINVDPAGRVRCAHGQFRPGIDFAAIPDAAAFPAAEVERVVRAEVGVTARIDLFSAPTLVVSVQKDAPTLVWKTEVVSLEKGIGAVFLVDATTGAIHDRIETVCSSDYSYTASTTGYGYDPHGNYRSLNLARRYSGGSWVGDYYLTDMTRDGDIYGYIDADDSYSTWGTDGRCTDSTTYWWGERTDQDGEVAGHYNMGKVLDYFESYHSRNSWDNSGGNVYMAYHAGDVNNAMSFGNGYFTFGDGTSGRLPTTSLDVCGHEFTHALLNDEGIDSDHAQSGAIHEALSDTFGCLIENVYGNAYNGTSNFKLGEDTWSGASSYFRDMANPDKDHFSEFNSSDSKHDNAEILNYANYLIWNGGTHPDSGVTVSGLGASKTRKILYKAVKSYLSGNSNPSFYDLRQAICEAAKEIHGQSSTELEVCRAAYNAIGVTAKNFDVIEWANDFDGWTCGGSTVAFGSADVHPGVWYPKYSLEDGTAAPGSYGEQLAMYPSTSSYSQIRGAFPIYIHAASSGEEPKLKVKGRLQEPLFPARLELLRGVCWRLLRAERRQQPVHLVHLRHVRRVAGLDDAGPLLLGREERDALRVGDELGRLPRQPDRVGRARDRLRLVGTHQGALRMGTDGRSIVSPRVFSGSSRSLVPWDPDVRPAPLAREPC